MKREIHEKRKYLYHLWYKTRYVWEEKIDIMINDIKQDMYEKKKRYLDKRYKSGYVWKVDTW